MPPAANRRSGTWHFESCSTACQFSHRGLVTCKTIEASPTPRRSLQHDQASANRQRRQRQPAKGPVSAGRAGGSGGAASDASHRHAASSSSRHSAAATCHHPAPTLLCPAVRQRPSYHPHHAAGTRSSSRQSAPSQRRCWCRWLSLPAPCESSRAMAVVYTEVKMPSCRYQSCRHACGAQQQRTHRSASFTSPRGPTPAVPCVCLRAAWAAAWTACPRPWE